MRLLYTHSRTVYAESVLFLVMPQQSSSDTMLQRPKGESTKFVVILSGSKLHVVQIPKSEKSHFLTSTFVFRYLPGYPE